MSHFKQPTTVEYSHEKRVSDDLAFLETSRSVEWRIEYRLRRKLGEGGQGMVFLADRMGADGVTMPVALKFFSRSRYASQEFYASDMRRIARIAARVGMIQQDHLLDVHNVVEYEGRRVMTMEWIDGFDLEHLLAPPTLEHRRETLAPDQWEHLNDVVITSGPFRARLKPGIAIAVLRECLSALAALHRDSIVHGDIKPANVMLKRTGNAKIIDLGSAVELQGAEQLRLFTPRYAAPEVLQGGRRTPSSDLASLGYVLVEILSGRRIFDGISEFEDLVLAKNAFPEDVSDILPHEVAASDSLMQFILALTQPDPVHRFTSAEDADLLEFGAANFQRELIAGNLASEYEHDLRNWLRELP